MVTNHLANLGDQQLAHEVIACLDFVRTLREGAIATGCHVGAHRAPTGAMILMVTGGCYVDAAVAYSYFFLLGEGGEGLPLLNQDCVAAVRLKRAKKKSLGFHRPAPIPQKCVGACGVEIRSPLIEIVTVSSGRPPPDGPAGCRHGLL